MKTIKQDFIPMGVNHRIYKESKKKKNPYI